MRSHYTWWARALSIFALTFITIATVSAQRTLSGTIIDGETDEPLIGANILVVGTATGTITDFDGNYELEVPDADPVQLRITYTGYATEEIDLTSDQSTLDIQMRSGSDLEEVVVVGYGTQTQDEVTSAVASVKEEDFNKGIVNNPTQLVQGKVAGLQIVSPSGGDVNAGNTLRLRGLSSLGASTSPLIIIDGVIGATLNSVDPSDVASIDVLKDGSAAAIYGTQASAGVVLITTKQGRPGETKVTYNVTGGLELLAKKVPVASAQRYAELRGTDSTSVDFGAENDLQEQLTRNALSQIHNLSLSGGLGTGSYRASFNYRNVEGVPIFSGFDQLNGRLTAEQSAFDGMLNFQATVSTTSRNSEFGFSDAFRYATIFNPTIPIRGTENPEAGYVYEGGFAQVDQFDYFNPIAINDQNSSTGNTRNSLLSGKVIFSPIDGLDLSAQYSQNRENGRNDLFFSRDSRFVGAGRRGLADRRNFENRNNLFELTGIYGTNIGSDKNSIEFLAGYSYQQYESENSRILTGDIISDRIRTNNLGFSSDARNGLSTPQSGGDRYEIESFFSRVSLDIDNTYFLQASVRQDGSTRFGVDEKRGVFPAISGGVNLANFVNSPSVNTLKLRVGYGITGALPGVSLLSKELLRSGQFYPILDPSRYDPTVEPLRSANRLLKFEKKGEFNAGLDFAFLDYKLTGTFDYFLRRTTDLLYNFPVPIGGISPGGDVYVTPTIDGNLGDVAFQNQGVEVSLGYDIAAGSNFSWTPRLIFATVKTILDTVDAGDNDFTFFSGGVGEVYQANPFPGGNTSPGAPGQNDAPTQVIRAGEEIGQIYTYVFQGVSEDGDYLFENLNGDLSVDGSDSITIAGARSPDKQVVGFGLPDFTLGFQNDFRVGPVDVSLFFRGAFGHSLSNLNRAFYENVADSRGTDNIVTTKYFDENLSPTTVRFNSLYVEKADFVSLDNASIGYNFDLPDDNLLQSLRVGLSGQRLFYITGYTGVDPEVKLADAIPLGTPFDVPPAANPLAPGIDRRNNYFRTRSFNLSVSVSF